MRIGGSGMELSELKLGEKAQVVSLRMDQSLCLRLLALGIIPGSTIELWGKGPLDDPQIYLVRGCRLALRWKDAKNILVKKEREQQCELLR